MGLYDAILIKENHAALVGGVGEGGEPARGAMGSARPSAAISTRCARPSRPEPTVCCSTTWTSPACANRWPRRGAGAAAARGLGGVTLENVADVAATGVDFISVGALTTQRRRWTSLEIDSA